MNNILLKVVKVGLISTALYFGGQACKVYGYIRGYSDASEDVFDALNTVDEEQKNTILSNHSEIGSAWKDMKSTLQELKTSKK